MEEAKQKAARDRQAALRQQRRSAQQTSFSWHFVLHLIESASAWLMKERKKVEKVPLFLRSNLPVEGLQAANAAHRASHHRDCAQHLPARAPQAQPAPVGLGSVTAGFAPFISPGCIPQKKKKNEREKEGKQPALPITSPALTRAEPSSFCAAALLILPLEL